MPRNLPDELGWIPFATIDREGQTHTAGTSPLLTYPPNHSQTRKKNDIQPPAAIIVATDKRR